MVRNCCTRFPPRSRRFRDPGRGRQGRRFTACGLAAAQGAEPQAAYYQGRAALARKKEDHEPPQPHGDMPFFSEVPMLLLLPPVIQAGGGYGPIIALEAATLLCLAIGFWPS